MNIKIENAWGEHGEIMTLYCNNEKVKAVQINDAKNEAPDTLLDYLMEFDIPPSEATTLGIEACTDLDTEPKFENNGTLVWII